ncbi:MAG: BamA/TamA family outer membrane protein [FCB group bacterium]|nr:BamA/TamA family outer membrane protein [FCB group bacterium]
MTGSVRFRFTCIFIILTTLIGILAAGTNPSRQPKIGLVLSGGGAKGFVHIGALKVIEEAGIHIDYIAGTSMGAFIGALYAVGYSPEQIQTAFLAQDWSRFQEDKISRRNVSIINKDENDIFIRTFSVKGGKVELPPGLVAGQKLSVFINRLLWPAAGIQKFTRFPIPFRCVTTNLVTGKAEVFDSGDLGEILRASMSLLTIFTPVEIDDKLLVDGGLVRNFPVSDVLDMGADVVVGVDVTAPLYTKKQLNSLPRIIDQSLSFQAVTSTQAQRLQCDILIAPDIRNYNMGSFSAAEELIRLGEREARKALPQLVQLMDSLGIERIKRPHISPETLAGPLRVVDLKLTGLRRIPAAFCISKLDISLPTVLTPADVERSIASLYGSGYFKRVTYRLEKAAGGFILVVKVEEKSNNQFKFSLHYDSDLKSAVLLNTTFRNIAGQGSKFSLNFRLSEMPTLEASYFIYAGWKLGLGFRVTAKFEEFDPYVWNYAAAYEDVSFEHRTHSLNFSLQTLVLNSLTAGAGLDFDHTRKNKKYLPAAWQGEAQYDQINFKGFLRFDTLDKIAYPHQGVRLSADFTSVHQNQIWKNTTGRRPYAVISGSYETAIPFGSRLTIIERAGVGAISGNEVKWKHYFKLGGMNNYDQTVFPFTGLDFLEIAGRNLLLAGVTLQLEAWKNNYLILETNWARINDGSPGQDFAALLRSNSSITGYGVKFGYDSVIGPMEFSVVGSNRSSDLFVNINIGYPF